MQSQEKVKGKQAPSSQGNERKSVKEELSNIKPSDLLVRTPYHENSRGKPPPRLNHLPPGPSFDTWGLWGLQFEMK